MKSYARVARKTISVPHWQPDGTYSPYSSKTGFKGRHRVRINAQFLRDTTVGMGPVLNFLRNVSEAAAAGVLPAEFQNATVHVVHPNRLYMDGILNRSSPLSQLIEIIPEAMRRDPEAIGNQVGFCLRSLDPANPEIFIPLPTILLEDAAQQCVLKHTIRIPNTLISLLKEEQPSVKRQKTEKPRVVFMGGLNAMDYGQLMLIQALKDADVAEVIQFKPVMSSREIGGAAIDIGKLREIDPHFICLSTMNMYEELTRGHSSMVRKYLPQAIQIFGGPMVTDFPEISAASFPEADVLMRGQAEYALANLLSIWGTTPWEGPFSTSQRDALAQVPGTIIRLADETLVTDIDQSNFITSEGFVLPSVELMEESFEEDSPEGNSVYFSRFCSKPGCTYCGLPFGAFYTAPVETALQFIRDRLIKEEKPFIRVMDDDALGNPDFYIDLKAAMEQEGLLGKVTFKLEQTALRGFEKQGEVNHALIQTLKDLGVEEIHIGLDGAHQGALDEFRKTPDFETSLKILLALKKQGFNMDINLIGLPPSTTLEDLARLFFHRKIFEFLGIPVVAINLFVGPIHGTPMGNLFIETHPKAMQQRQAEVSARFKAPSHLVPRYALWTDEFMHEFRPSDPAVRQLLETHPIHRDKIEYLESPTAEQRGEFLLKPPIVDNFPPEFVALLETYTPAQRWQVFENLCKRFGLVSGTVADALDKDKVEAFKFEQGAFPQDLVLEPMAYLMRHLPEAALSVVTEAEPFPKAKIALIWQALHDPELDTTIKGKVRALLAETRFRALRRELGKLTKEKAQAALNPSAIEAELPRRFYL